VELVLRLDRQPRLDAALAGQLGVGPQPEVLERRPVEPGDLERLLPGGVLAGVDVDEGERRPVGPLEMPRASGSIGSGNEGVRESEQRGRRGGGGLRVYQTEFCGR